MAARAPRPSKEGNGRPRRFVLPAEEDTRTTEAIEGFVVGHRRRRGPSPAVLALRGRGSALVRPDPLAALAPRLEWRAALEAEDVRHVRYRRPVTVAVLELRRREANGGAGIDGAAILRFADLLRRETRATDRITRLGSVRFGVLLPETNELQAAHLVERLRARVGGEGAGLATLVVRAGWASPRRGEGLVEAVARAEERLGTEGD
ncbi:MAG TPA: hypothetical protein VNO86_06130 [Candidatus Binatia bacterium]|nr:hypothetical protein [Candidatus Binatia bacterium]